MKQKSVKKEKTMDKDEESADIDAYADELFDKEMRMMNRDYSDGKII